MLKFLRKYNKWILVIGGALLMVAFLLPQTLSQLGASPAGATYARIDGRKVTIERANLAAREYWLLDQLAQGAMAPAIGIESADHWMLLAELAERSGYVGDQRDGEEYLGEAIRQFFIQLLFVTQRGWMLNQPGFEQVMEAQVAAIEGRRDDLALRASLTDEQFNMALAKLRGVMRMMEARRAAARLSRPRIAAEAQRRLDQATIDYVFISADTRLTAVAEPTDEELAAHFDAFKDKRPGEGDYGFGYLLADRLKVEVLKLDRAAIAERVRPDEVEIASRLTKYRQDNPDDTDEAAYQAVRAQVVRENVDEALRLARQAVQIEVDRAQRGLPTNGDYVVLPPDYAEKRPTLEQLADAIVARVEQDRRVRVRMPRPTIERPEGWLTQGDLGALDGIGRAFLERGTQREPFPFVALRVREIAGDNVLGLQKGVLQARPVQDAPGNQYYFRILDARKESAPDSVDEIRERVATDLKRLRAYEALKKERDALLAQAIALGLEAVASSAVSQAGPVSEEEALSVQNATVTRVRAGALELDSEAFRTAVVDLADDLDPTRPVDATDVISRTLAMGVDDSLGLVVAQITGWRPLSLERFRIVEPNVARQMVSEQMQRDQSAPFSLEALVKRMNVEFKSQRADEDDQDEGETGESDQAA